jgi:hypothetical protein
VADHQDSNAAKAYAKEQILNSPRYPQKDVLMALLRADQKYTHDQVKELMNDFLQREVK